MQRKDLKLVDDDEDEQGIIKEDNIRVNTATTIVRQKAPKTGTNEQRPDVNPSVGGFSAGQTALMQNINDGRRVQYEDLLTETPDIPVYGEDPVRSLFLTSCYCNTCPI